MTTMPPVPPRKPTYRAKLEQLKRLPNDLVERDQWVLWSYEFRDGKWTKMPRRPGGGSASTTDPTTWSSYEEVLTEYLANPSKYAGIGFVFSHDDSFCGIDLDNCFDKGRLKPYAQAIVDQFPDSYMEVSPSGTGLKIIIQCKLPGSGIPKRPNTEYPFEMYDAGRFFTITGFCFHNAPLEIAEYQILGVQLYHKHKPARVLMLPRGSKAEPPQVVAKGERHNFLVSQAGGLRKRGLRPNEINAALQAINAERCTPPYDTAHVRKIAESTERWTPGEMEPKRLALARPDDTPDSDPMWMNDALKSANGSPKSVLANAIFALRAAPEWRGVLAFNAFSLNVEIKRETPWGGKPSDHFSDNDARLFTEWLHKRRIYVSVEVAWQAIYTAAEESHFHPVRDYFNALKWDGVPRLGMWLSDYLGVDAKAYKGQAGMIGVRWVISGVARVFEPGCQADGCLILEGPQGIGKSTALRILGGSWFTDEVADLGSKDSAMQTAGVLLIELAEVDALSKAEISRIKAWITRRVDRFRPPYGRTVIKFERQCIFAGTVNDTEYLRDPTGARRFLPVLCTRIKLKELARDRDQLWAEAVVMYRGKHPWWLDTEDLVNAAEDEQADRFSGDAWDEKILDWADIRGDVSVSQILEMCLEKRKCDWTQQDQTRIAKILIHAGWKKYRAREGERRENRYRKCS